MKDYLGKKTSTPQPASNTGSTWQRDLNASPPASPEGRSQALEGISTALTQAEKGGPAIQRKTGIPDEVRGNMEQSLGADFSNVKVHTNSVQAKKIGAVAFTRGNDVHFAPGQYNPGSSSGKELLGHELAHVVQQRQGRVKATGSVGGLPLNDSPKLEQEADRMGAKAASFRGGN